MAKKMMDISLTAGEDLEITADGDFAVVESTQQHQRQLTLNAKGDFKENPTICVNAFNFLDGENFEGLMREIAAQFAMDGMDVSQVGLDTDGQIKANASYK